jgi:NAD+ diphosphatase
MSAVVSAPINLFGGLSLDLDRRAERRDDDAWLIAQQQHPHARYLLLDMHGAAYLDAQQERLRWLSHADYQRWLAGAPCSLLGVDSDGCPYFLLGVEHADRADALLVSLTSRRIGLREAGLLLPAFEAALFAYAKGLLHWQRETRHCSYCGAALELVAAGHRLRCTDLECGRLHFPRTDAAIIVIVEHADACLLGRQRSWPAGRYSTLAGFVEPGESLEDAVRREVAEEAGVRVGEVQYHSSQPWPMPASLMLGFTASALSATIELRDDELEDARWFTAAQIAAGLADGSFDVPTPLSISYQLIAHWLRQRAGLELAELIAARHR